VVCNVPWWVSHVTVGASTGKAAPVTHRRRSATPPPSSLSTGPPVPVRLVIGDNDLLVNFPLTRNSSDGSEPGPVDGMEDSTEGIAAKTDDRSAAIADAVESRRNSFLLVRASRQEPLRRLFPGLRPYEISQLSIILFVIGICLALQWEVVPWQAGPTLAVIPFCRTWPDLLCLFNPKYFGAVSSTRLRRAAASVLCCVTVVWFAYLLLFRAREVYGPYAKASPWSPSELPPTPPEVFMPSTLPPPVMNVDCAGLDGVDCNEYLAAWAGERNCVTLARTDGTCKSYCAAHQRLCIKAADDIGTGACEYDKGGHHRQSTAENGCLQDWGTQLCVCSEPDRPPATTSLPPAQHERMPAVEVPRPPPPLPTTTSSALAPEGESEAVVEVRKEPPCFFKGIRYDPQDMPGHGRSFTESAIDCQRRCARTAGCARFTWWLSEGGECRLQEYRAVARAAPWGTIAGPSSCDDEAELERLLSTSAPPAPPPLPPRSPTTRAPQAVAADQVIASSENPSRLSSSGQVPHGVGKTVTPLLSEGSPHVVFIVVLAFALLSLSGVLDRP